MSDDWKAKLEAQAKLMRDKANARTDEEKRASIDKARETRRKNREAKMVNGTDPNWLTKQIAENPKQKGRPRKDAVNLDEMAQQMGFTSASDALLTMAVRNAGFPSIQAAAMWAVKAKSEKKTDPVSAAVGGGWSGYDD